MDTKFKVIVGLLLLSNTVLIIFLSSYMMQTRDDVNGLRSVLATKEDVLNVSHKPQADVLEKNCTKCHAENKFAGFHGTEAEMMAMIERMQTQSGSHVDVKDADAIHASLTMLQCNSCHDAQTTRKLALKLPGEQKEVIRDMLAKAGSKAADEDVDRLHKSYQQLLGF